ncbi:MAG: hypothetical protein LBT31_01235 [Synergistaceae bacterium]|nr:hypothetical protein [Synergistaceae bacterium]
MRNFLKHRSDTARPAGSGHIFHRAVLTSGALVIAVCFVFAGALRQAPASAAPLAPSASLNAGVFARAPERVMLDNSALSDDVPRSQDKKK